MNRLLPILSALLLPIPVIAQGATSAVTSAPASVSLVGTYYGEITAPQVWAGAFIIKIKSQEGKNLAGTSKFTLVTGPCSAPGSLTGTVEDDGTVKLEAIGVLDCKWSFDMRITEDGRVLVGKFRAPKGDWEGLMKKQ